MFAALFYGFSYYPNNIQNLRSLKNNWNWTKNHNNMFCSDNWMSWLDQLYRWKQYIVILISQQVKDASSIGLFLGTDQQFWPFQITYALSSVY